MEVGLRMPIEEPVERLCIEGYGLKPVPFSRAEFLQRF
jgi:hypothetical protein